MFECVHTCRKLLMALLSRLVSWSLQLLPMSKISVYLGAKFFPWKPAGGQKAEKQANRKIVKCFKEEIREFEMGKTSQTITNPVSRIFHIISLQRLFVSLNSAFYVNISPDNAFWGFARLFSCNCVLWTYTHIYV